MIAFCESKSRVDNIRRCAPFPEWIITSQFAYLGNGNSAPLWESCIGRLVLKNYKAKIVQPNTREVTINSLHLHSRALKDSRIQLDLLSAIWSTLHKKVEGICQYLYLNTNIKANSWNSTKYLENIQISLNFLCSVVERWPQPPPPRPTTQFTHTYRKRSVFSDKCQITYTVN